MEDKAKTTTIFEINANNNHLNNTIIDITDHDVLGVELDKLKLINLSGKDILVRDNNWFGGTWTLQDFLMAEEKLDRVVSMAIQKNLSPFEAFIFFYIYASNREYKPAPKGSPFQKCRSYVDAVNSGYCVCVGYATILKRLCEKYKIECAVQGCFAKDKYGKVINHANILVRLIDKKYDIKGLYYSDPRMDAAKFQDVKGLEDAYKFNMLLIPMSNIGKILIRAFNDDTIIEMNDFKSIYYSRKPKQEDLVYFSKFFKNYSIEEIMIDKYCSKISTLKILDALRKIGISEDKIIKTQRALVIRDKCFLTNNSDLLSSDNKNNGRIEFVQYLIEFLKHPGRPKTELDCATLVSYVFKNFFDIDVLSGGYGDSWTGKIMTSKNGTIRLIDENKSIQEKIDFIDQNCKAGDILLFHRQSHLATQTEPGNCYPGHCAIYLGNHKYIDSRLTTRGDINVVNVDDDNYMQNFIGVKDLISSVNKSEFESV